MSPCMTGNQKTLDPDAVNVKYLPIVQQHFFIVDRRLRQLVKVVNDPAACFSDQIPVLDLTDVQIRISEQPGLSASTVPTWSVS